MADATTEMRIEARPYKPSWIDRFNDWVARLPINKEEGILYAELDPQWPRGAKRSLDTVRGWSSGGIISDVQLIDFQ